MGFSKWIDLAIPKPEPGMASSMPYDLPAPSGPQYPYGMRINLTKDCLEKAELDCNDCKRGDQIDLRAFGEVMSINEDGSVTVQLQKIKVENEDTEDEKD